MSESQIVKNASKGYGYRYASLGDMAKQGVKIPQMCTRLVDGIEFVFYKDDAGEWVQGARVVVPAMKGSNEAQAYGSALTYARRFTTALALGLATADDDNVEAARPSASYGPRGGGQWQGNGVQHTGVPGQSSGRPVNMQAPHVGSAANQ